MTKGRYLNFAFLSFSLSVFSTLVAQETKPPEAQYRLLVETPCHVKNLSFSTDGQYLAYSCDDDIYFLGLRDIDPVRISSPDFKESNPAWSPDGTKIAYQKDSSGTSNIWVYSRISKVHTRVTKIRENTFDPSWAPNGRSIAFSTDSYGSVDVMIKDFDYNKERRLTAAKGDEYIFGFHPGGNYVGYFERGTAEEDLYAVSLTGKEALPITRSEYLEYNPRWSYDGSRVIYYVNQSDRKTIYTADFPYGELNKIGSFQFDLSPVISANGGRVIYQDIANGSSQLYLHTIETRESVPLGLNDFADINQLAWSLGGRIIAMATVESEINGRIWLVNISQFLR